MLTYDFSPLFRSTIGFDSLSRLLDSAVRLAEANDAWPAYNIEKTGDETYRLTMVVAGFDKRELAVEQTEDTLTVSGRKADENGGAYLYRGIAPSSFSRSFQLAEHVKVTGANLVDGLLTVDLVREVPEALRPRRIEIGASRPSLAQKAKKLIEGKAETEAA
jgi:molecular chaperone IbpA